MTVTPGTRLGPFEILSAIGAGGMGEVYRARDLRLGRDAALKVLPRELMSDRERLIRFAQEARSASALNHPNIVTIYEIGQADGQPFMAMELIDGRTLRDLVNDGALTIRKALDLATQLADGLAKAHEAHIVHRDLKPENVMVTRDGFVKILDFGLAKLAGPDPASGEPAQASMTRTGFVLGTAGYMSPEQASGRPVDFRSDQFAAGLIFYEMLSGRRAFQRGSAVQTLSAIIQEEPEPLERLNPRVPPPLRWVVERCLAKDPEERYAASRDLARELRQIRDNLTRLQETPEPVAPLGAAPAPVVPTIDIATPSGGAEATRLTAVATPTPAPVRAPFGDPAPAAEPARTKKGHALEMAVLFLVGLALVAAAGYGGWYFRGQATEPPARRWTGEVLLGSTTPALSPRVSPDGKTLAFVTLVSGVSQVAVLSTTSGDWTVLTHQEGAGSVYKVDWTADGSKILFDRVTDVPKGVYSVPAIGGPERLVGEDAQTPEALPDGSLLVVKPDAERNFQIHRLWPETGKLVAVGPPIVAEGLGLALRTFPDGKEALFSGRLAGSEREERVRRIWSLDLDSGKAAPFAPELPLAPPFAVGGDGHSVLATLVAGDVQSVVSVSRDGGNARYLAALTSRAWALSQSRDGRLYVGTVESPAELLKFAPAGGVPERLATTAANLVAAPVQLSDGRCLVPAVISGRRRLLVTTKTGDVRSLLDVAEQASPPAAPLGKDRIVFLSGGTGAPPLLAIATTSDGRIVKRLDDTRGIAAQSLGASPDGTKLWYVEAGALWTVAVAGGAPQRLRPATGFAVDAHDPARPALVVEIAERTGARLVRMPLAGGVDETIPWTSPLRLSATPIAANAVGPDGRIAVTVTSPDAWYRGPALLDPVTGAVTKVPVLFQGDVLATTFGGDGSLLGWGVALRSALWRFEEEGAAPHAAPSK